MILYIGDFQKDIREVGSMDHTQRWYRSWFFVLLVLLFMGCGSVEDPSFEFALLGDNCTSSARMGHFGFQVKRQSEPMLIGLV